MFKNEVKYCKGCNLPLSVLGYCRSTFELCLVIDGIYTAESDSYIYKILYYSDSIDHNNIVKLIKGLIEDES